DRSDLAERADLARSGPRRTASGVVAIGDVRSTVVMPGDGEQVPNAALEAAELPGGAEPLDPRGTVRIVDDAQRERLRRTTVRATREEIFGSAPASWEDDEPEVHMKRRFEAMAAEVV